MIIQGRNVIDKIGGKTAGNGFLDDFSVTKKTPRQSAKWNEGLPVYAVDYSLTETAYWKVVEEGGQLNGVSEFSAGTHPDALCLISSKQLNRYQAGQKSYQLFTTAFGGIDQANGDYEALIGMVLRGLEEDAEFDQIITGIQFGYKKVGTQTDLIFRVTKNKVVTHEIVSDSWDGEVPFGQIEKSNLNIFDLMFGYLGIDPTTLNVWDAVEQKLKQLHYQTYEQDTTNVSNPNLAIGVYIKNNGNTNPITIRNGSFQFGNFSDRAAPDPSARPLITTFERATVAAGATTALAAFRVPTKITMIKELNALGIVTDTFRNTINNQLISAKIFAALQNINKPAVINFYFTPVSNLTGVTWNVLRANRNLLERSDTFTITDRNLLEFFAAFDIISGRFNSEDVEKKQIELLPGIAAVVEYDSDSAATDLFAILDTLDLF